MSRAPADRSALALRLAPVALALALGLFAQGSRGLSEPDEGRNAQIAATMLSSGDWLVPRLDGAVYLDKPPVTFWFVASSLASFGRTELAARLPMALAFAASAIGVAWLGAMLWGARAGPFCGAAYALSLGPFAGAAVLTPDTLLACAAAWTAALFWRATNDDGRSRFWLLAGAAAGLGLMIKGAAMLLLAFPLALSETARRRGLGWLRAGGPWLALAVALAVGLPWYVWTARQLPGAADYFFSNQVAGRMLDASYDRNAQWSKVATLYLPVLGLGALPWSPGWFASVRAFVARRRRREPFAASAEGWFVALCLVVPLVVFSIARSRLPLYLLPLFAPIALFAGRRLAESARGWTPRQWRARLALGLIWVALLGALKLTAALRPDPRDGRRLAAWVQASSEGAAVSESGAALESGAVAVPVWAVDADLHSLPFYLDRELRVASTRSEPYPMFVPVPPLAARLAEERPDAALFVTPRFRVEAVRQVAMDNGLDCFERPPTRKLAMLDCRRRAPRDS